MPTTDEARAEYVRQHVGGMQPVTTIGEKIEAAWDAGAEWERGRPISDEAVRSAALVIHDIECSCPNAGGHADATIEHRNKLARAALEAARRTNG